MCKLSLLLLFYVHIGALCCGYAMAAPQSTPKSVDELAPVFVPLEVSTATDTSQKNSNSEKPLEDSSYWRAKGFEQLEKSIKFSKKTHDTLFSRKAKNIIIFIGDGMGISTITAGRIYKGQYLKHNYGEEETLSFDNFPFTGMAKTYAVDKQVPDSACTATAIFSGIKTDYNAIGVDITRSKFNATQGRLQTIMDWAQAEGKRTGIVTTTSITDATPAASYAHIYHRDWQTDIEVPSESVGIHMDIARQLLEKAPGNKFNVIMGGGRAPMGALRVNETSTIEFEGKFEKMFLRGDGRNLAEEWLKLGQSNIVDDDKKNTRIFVQTREELEKVNVKTTNHLLGLFRNHHITFSIARQAGEPSLKEMTEAAIGVLERGATSKGYVLLVEGGRIDHGHHQNYARAAMHEVFEFDKAVQAALDLTNDEETLIIVTADHSHAVTMNGYPKRGADILGFVNDSELLAHETISYANGPGYWYHLANGTQGAAFAPIFLPLEQFTEQQRMSPTYRHMAALPRNDETHGGEDVAVFAHGPGASLVRGVFEQNYLAYVMSYAGCMGPAKQFDESCQPNRTGGSTNVQYSIALSLVLCLLSLFY